MKAKDLRNSILQLAIQGKLVPQDLNDEPAIELIKKIKEERQELIKQGKIKKDKQERYIFRGDDNKFYEKIGNETKDIIDEIPFDIPNSWEWVRLNKIVELLNGVKVCNKVLPLLDAKYLRTKTNHKIADCGVIVKKNEYLILVDGENSGEVFESFCDGIMGSTFKKLFISKFVNQKYILKFLSFYQKLFKQNKKGSAIPHLNKDIFNELLVSLPPLSEQQRIVSKIEKLEPFIKLYEEYETKLTELDNSFQKDIKKSILQFAIQGKLVPQDLNDEPAIELIKKIKEERQELIKQGKIKKDKQERYIFRGDDNKFYEKIGNETKDIIDEIPFDIPNSWEWVRLEEVCRLYTGNSIPENIKKSKYLNLNTGFNYIGTKDINYNQTINYDNGVKIPFEENKFLYANNNDILLCIEGGSAGRKIAILNQRVCFGNKLCCIHSYYNNFIYKYIYYFLQSPIFSLLFKEKITGIIGGVSINKIKESILPLPPLSEQQRIVAKIEELMNMINIKDVQILPLLEGKMPEGQKGSL